MPSPLPSHSSLDLHQLFGSCLVRLTRALPLGCTCGTGGVRPGETLHWGVVGQGPPGPEGGRRRRRALNTAVSLRDPGNWANHAARLAGSRCGAAGWRRARQRAGGADQMSPAVQGPAAATLREVTEGPDVPGVVALREVTDLSPLLLIPLTAPSLVSHSWKNAFLARGTAKQSRPYFFCHST